LKNKDNILLNCIWLLFLCFIITKASSQGVFAPDVAYYSKPVKASNKPLWFEYVFKEFKDSGCYINSIKTINWYSQFKKSPFKVENTTYYNPSLKFRKIDSLLKQKKITLNSLHYYIDVKSVKSFETHAEVNTRLPYEYIYQPFFIGNGEVTNAEYREFMYYVRDSIARTLLAYSGIKNPGDYGHFDKTNQKMILKWNKKIPYNSDDEELRLALAPIYLPEGERFYNRQEIDTRKLNYKFWLINDSLEIVINIAPDTLTWVHDLILNNENSCSLEPYCNMYLWHPSYNNYPVVGLTCNQIKAFLFWKTKKLQREIDKKGLKLLIEFDLPNEVELEMISLSNKLNSNLSFRKIIANYSEISKNYDFDLYLNAHSKIHYEFDKQLNLSNRARLLINNTCIKYNKSYHSIFPNSSRYEKNKSHSLKDSQGSFSYKEYLPYFNGNVSEWMHENFFNNDTTIYVTDNGKYRAWINNLSNRSITFPFKGNFEDSYLLYNDINGISNDFDDLKFKLIDSTILKNDLCKLVRGSNWFDSEDLATGIFKKTFVSKDSAFSTLGFRYVVRFKEK
jgi:hypothetical protein